MSGTARLIDVARRKERLLARIAQQREALAADCRVLVRPAALVDRGVEALVFVKSHPLLAGLAAAVIAVASRRRLAAWVGRGWVLWRAWRALARWRARYGV